MVKKIKVSPISDDACYTDVVDAVTENETANGPAVEEVEQPTEEPTESNEPAPERITETKLKKEAAKGTCENCGKTATVNNLRYSHNLIRPANNKQSESETVVEPTPEKPKLV